MRSFVRIGVAWKTLAIDESAMVQLLGTWSGLQILDRNVAAAAVFSMAFAAASHRLPKLMKPWTTYMGGGWALPLPLPQPLPQQPLYRRRESYTVLDSSIDKGDL